MSGRSSVVLFVVIACGLAAGLAFIPYTTDVATGQEKATYVGSGKCKSCHKDAYKAWESMKHSKASKATDSPWNVCYKKFSGRILTTSARCTIAFTIGTAVKANTRSTVALG